MDATATRRRFVQTRIECSKAKTQKNMAQKNEEFNFGWCGKTRSLDAFS